MSHNGGHSEFLRLRPRPNELLGECQAVAVEFGLLVRELRPRLKIRRRNDFMLTQPCCEEVPELFARGGHSRSHVRGARPPLGDEFFLENHWAKARYKKDELVTGARVCKKQDLLYQSADKELLRDNAPHSSSRREHRRTLATHSRGNIKSEK